MILTGLRREPGQNHKAGTQSCDFLAPRSSPPITRLLSLLLTVITEVHPSLTSLSILRIQSRTRVDGLVSIARSSHIPACNLPS